MLGGGGSGGGGRGGGVPFILLMSSPGEALAEAEAGGSLARGEGGRAGGFLCGTLGGRKGTVGPSPGGGAGGLALGGQWKLGDMGEGVCSPLGGNVGCGEPDGLGGKGGADISAADSWLLFGLRDCEGVGDPETLLPALAPDSFPPPPSPLVISCASWDDEGVAECFFLSIVLRMVEV